MPASSEGDSADDVRTPAGLHRPGLLYLIKYSYGGRLPRRYNAWVMHDLTCSTWALRHFARWILLITAPLLALYLFLAPGSWGLRLITGLTFAGALVLFSMINIAVDTDKRAIRAGYGYSEAGRVRERRTADKHRAAVAARRERIERRRTKRLDP